MSHCVCLSIPCRVRIQSQHYTGRVVSACLIQDTKETVRQQGLRLPSHGLCRIVDLLNDSATGAATRSAYGPYATQSDHASRLSPGSSRFCSLLSSIPLRDFGHRLHAEVQRRASSKKKWHRDNKGASVEMGLVQVEDIRQNPWSDRWRGNGIRAVERPRRCVFPIICFFFVTSFPLLRT